MTIKDILETLATATTPVAKVLQKGEQYKIIGIGFKKGMLLKEHTTPIVAKLIVLQGVVKYKEGVEEKILGQYDETPIPIGVLHSVEALEDALCLLVQG